MSCITNMDSKNNKLNSIEIMKLEKDGLDVIATILNKYSNQGYDSITKDDMDRFKWAGVYQQRVKSSDVAQTIETLILFYKKNRNFDETFNQFVNRVGIKTFKENI